MAEQAASSSAGGASTGRVLGAVHQAGQHAGAAVNSGPARQVAGFILAIGIWGWVILPFIKGGPTGVRNVLRAKFFNKGPDGKWLP